MNRVFLIGRLVRDPEIRTSQNGTLITDFTIAVDRFKNNEADFIKIICYQKLAENCGNSLAKGQRALVEGRLQIRSFEGKDGQKRWVTEIVAQSVEFLDRAKQSTDTASQFGHDVEDEQIPL